MDFRLYRSMLAFCLFIALGLSSIPVAAEPKASNGDSAIVLAKRARFLGDIIFVRGGFNVFSAGLDQMAKTLVKKGIKSRVTQFTDTDSTVSTILRHQKQFGRKPVILIGHSLGANQVIRIAQILLKKRVRVNYMALFAATNPKPIPRNVIKATNYYFKTNGWGKPILRGKGTRGRIKNIDLSPAVGIHHFNIEKMPKLQRQVIRNILRRIRRRAPS